MIVPNMLLDVRVLPAILLGECVGAIWYKAFIVVVCFGMVVVVVGREADMVYVASRIIRLIVRLFGVRVIEPLVAVPALCSCGPCGYRGSYRTCWTFGQG